MSSKKILKFFRPEIQKQKPYILVSYPKAIKLNQNELPYPWPTTLKAKLIKRLKPIQVERYPLVQPIILQKKLAQQFKLNPEQILVSNGSNVMIQTLLASCAVKGRVMGVIPSFSLYELAAKNLGNRFIGVGLNKKDFSLPIENFLKKMKATKPNIIFLANPNAPTGNLFPKQELLEIIKKSPGLVVIDEAYFQFSNKTLLPYLKKYPQLILLRTFSKGYGLGGARVGYALGHAEVIEQVAKVLTPYCVSPINEEAAILALEENKYFEKKIKEILTERKRVLTGLKQLKFLECFPSEANFILFRLKNVQACFQHLLKKGILIRDVSNYAGLKGCLRVSIGTPKENTSFLQAIRSYKD